ncbi:hypothetical protein PENSPDRAFT_743297 [Peniophora sp. CONT]|nr:hypothetical protein PENSPDRAFT_743297 [Peniophora sp. CONT]
MSSYAGVRHAPSAFASPASTTLFRRLVWEGTVPLEIRVDSKELPANSNRGLEVYFVQAPRVTYLPLLVPELKRFLSDIVFDEEAARVMNEEDWWFESEEGAPLKWHWPIGLIYDNHSTVQSTKPVPAQKGTPLRLVLHLASPPTDKLLLAPSADACKQAFMGQLKEADFLRWGSTKRMTGLRKAEQDGIWEGIKEHNFDDYWRVASKVTPTTTPATRPSSPPGSFHTRPPSADPQGAPDRDGAYSVRSVPLRLYLPDGPVIQDLAPPLLEDGTPNTLADFLGLHLPALFPLPSPSAPLRPLGFALVQGVRAPAESELAWLGACMTGADGWVNVCIGLLRGRT